MPNDLHGFSTLPEDFIERCRRVSLLILDVDGVLTDGGLYFNPDGSMTKRFNVQDGLGIGVAIRAGIRVAVITGQDSPSVAARMRVLGITDYYAGKINKLDSYADLMRKYGLEAQEAAYLGDDWIDLSVMSRVGLPLAVNNAQPEVKALAAYTTQARGGDGAVREIVNLLLHSRGMLADLAQRWKDGHPE